MKIFLDTDNIESKKKENALVSMDYQLAYISRIVGKSRLDEGYYTNVHESFCNSLERAMRFNNVFFYETLQQISKNIIGLAERGEPKIANSIREHCLNYFQQMQVEPAKQELVQKVIDTMQQIGEDIKTLAPI